MEESSVDFLGVAGGQNLLVLATAPGDESRFCAGLIAEACLRGRPPFVAVLTDGSSAVIAGSNAGPDAVAAALERQTRAAVGQLGVPSDWFLMLGLIDGTAPLAGRKFDAVVAAVSLIMWRRDCNVLVAPSAGDPRPDYAACHEIAMAVAGRSGVGLVTYPTGANDRHGTLRLQARPAAMRRANAAAATAGVQQQGEIYCPVQQTAP
jgi:LmbE family N-acetylglucosaminyl deacetylase